MAKKNKLNYIDGYNKGYEWGKSQMICTFMQILAKMKDTKATKYLKEFIHNKYEEYIPAFGETEPTAYEKKFLYIYTFKYRGIDIDVYDDDAGQQVYFYYKGKSHSCGCYNLDYEGYIKEVIDRDLDMIFSFATIDDRFFGAYCEYADHKHTKVNFTFRGELMDTYELKDKTLEEIISKCTAKLQRLFKNPEFIKMEEERKASGNLYFNEVVEKLEKEMNQNA